MKNALLVIDIQNGLTLKKNLFHVDEFINTVNRAIDIFHQNEDRVIFIQHNNKMLAANTADWQIDSRIKKHDTDLVFQKDKGNAFTNPELVKALKETGITHLIICGLVTHGCVANTCLGASTEGFKASILLGGHTNWHKQAQEKIDETEKHLSKAGIPSVSI